MSDMAERLAQGKRFQIVYSDDHKCLGSILARGVEGFEAFDSACKSLGLHPTPAEAAAAITAKVAT